MKIHPLQDRILVKRVDEEETTSGGIIIPDSAKEKPAEGTIVALGEGRLLADGKRTEFTVKSGDHVLFTSYAGTDVEWDGQEYLIMSEDDILGVIEG